MVDFDLSSCTEKLCAVQGLLLTVFLEMCRKNVLSSEQRALMDLLTNGKEVGSVRIDISSMAEGDIVKGWYPVQCLKPHWILTCEVSRHPFPHPPKED
jgi:hypothetical protein